jgi:rod shape-determining protein MreB
MRIRAYRTGLATRDMAIDAGTSTTLVYAQGYGIVISEPTLLAMDPRTGDVRAVGSQAEEVLGPSEQGLKAVRPVRHGVVADFERTQRLLWHVVRRVQHNRWSHPRVVMCVAPDVGTIHTRALGEACLEAGAREIYLIESPIAAAYGAELPAGEPAASMVLDVGAGKTTCGVISLGGVVASASVATGGDDLDEAIVKHLKREHKLAVDRGTAEQMKLQLGSAFAQRARSAAVIGQDTISGQPKDVLLSSEEVRAVLAKPLGEIIQTVRDTLAGTPPELASDIIDRGIVLTGGGSLLSGLPERLRHETQMPVQLAESPRTCLVTGAGHWLEHMVATDSSRSSLRSTVSAPAIAMR